MNHDVQSSRQVARGGQVLFDEVETLVTETVSEVVEDNELAAEFRTWSVRRDPRKRTPPRPGSAMSAAAFLAVS